MFRLQPLFDIQQRLASAQAIPIADKSEHRFAHGHQSKAGIGAVLIPIHLLADEIFRRQHLRS